MAEVNCSVNLFIVLFGEQFICCLVSINQYAAIVWSKATWLCLVVSHTQDHCEILLTYEVGIEEMGVFKWENTSEHLFCSTEHTHEM